MKYYSSTGCIKRLVLALGCENVVYAACYLAHRTPWKYPHSRNLCNFFVPPFTTGNRSIAHPYVRTYSLWFFPYLLIIRRVRLPLWSSNSNELSVYVSCVWTWVQDLVRNFFTQLGQLSSAPPPYLRGPTCYRVRPATPASTTGTIVSRNTYLCLSLSWGDGGVFAYVALRCASWAWRNISIQQH